MMTSVVLLEKTLTAAPPVPDNTMAALALVRPSEFINETPGCGWPVGQIVRKPRGSWGTTVTFNAYAVEPRGRRQLLFCGSGKLLEVSPWMGGPPKGPFGLRVSTTRQGVTGVNRKAWDPGPLTISSCAAAEIAISARASATTNVKECLTILISSPKSCEQVD